MRSPEVPDQGRRRCDDLLASQRSAAALDQALPGIAFVSAVDVQCQFARAVEIDDADAVLLESRSALFRTRHRSFDAIAHRTERVDEMGHRRARTHADDAAMLDIAERALRGLAFFFLAAGHCGCHSR